MHGPVLSSIVPQYTGTLSKKYFGSQLLVLLTIVLYGPVSFTIVPYKYLVSLTVHFSLQKGQCKNKEKLRKNLKWKNK